jgi:hypothetical protein
LLYCAKLPAGFCAARRPGCSFGSARSISASPIKLVKSACIGLGCQTAGESLAQSQQEQYHCVAIAILDRLSPLSERMYSKAKESLAQCAAKNYIRLRGILRDDASRFIRLTNDQRKGLRRHTAMMALFVAWYDFARKHEALKGNTPAMAGGLGDHVWKIKEVIERAASA